MLSQQTIYIINKRCQEATGKFDLSFGGLNFIMTGDPGQLLPVSATPLYHNPPKSVEGYICYRNFDCAIRLHECVRQEIDGDPNQQRFIELLPRIRNAVKDSKTADDWQFLLKNEYNAQKAVNFTNALRLYADNNSCHQFNRAKIVSLGILTHY